MLSVFDFENLNVSKTPQTQSYQNLTVLTVSDHIITEEVTSSEELQTTFNDMMIVALKNLLEQINMLYSKNKR